MKKKLIINFSVFLFLIFTQKLGMAETYKCTILESQTVDQSTGKFIGSKFIPTPSTIFVDTETGKIFGDPVTNQRSDAKKPQVLHRGTRGSNNIKIFTEIAGGNNLGDVLVLQILLTSPVNKKYPHVEAYPFMGTFYWDNFSGVCVKSS
jgi:hypothetical protein